MKKQNDEESLHDLRSRATAKVASGDYSAPTDKDPIALVHELSVHQIELEMQNEELRHAQAEAHELYEKFLDLYDFAPVCYFTLDRNGRIVEANLTACAYLKCDRSLLINTPFRSLIRPPSYKAFDEFMAVALASGARERCEVQLVRGRKMSGRAIIEGMAVTSEESEAKEIRVTLTDVTELRDAEDALRRLNAELETRVRERTAELRDKDRMLILQSRQAAMGEMIGNISHQWRQPLNALGLMVQSLALMGKMGELKQEKLETTVNSAMELIKHMAGTIEDFRNYFKPDRERVPFYLESAVARSLGLVGESFRARRITVNVIKNSDPLVTGFPNEFSQAFLNILLNARDAFEEREVKEPRVVIVVDKTDSGAGLLTITDNAGGIPVDIIDKIFEPYFTTKSPDKGTGVGLFMAKSIIEKSMGGQLTVRNTGAGAEFRMVL